MGKSYSNFGYLTSFSESDLSFNVSSVANVTSNQISNWNLAFEWGNHSNQGYLTSFSESDPNLTLSTLQSLVSNDFHNLGGSDNNTQLSESEVDAFVSNNGYLTSYNETDPSFSNSASATISIDNISEWDLAYLWGNHSTFGYLTSFSESDPNFSSWDKSLGINITESQVSDLDKYTQNEVDGLVGGKQDNLTGNETIFDSRYVNEEDYTAYDDGELKGNVSANLGNITDLENRALKNNDGFSVYLRKGWNTFKLPWFVLTGTSQVGASNLSGNYSVGKVLENIESSYSYLAYYNGSNWRVYAPGSVEDDFTEFPSGATSQDYDFHIYMIEGDRLEFGIV